MKKQVNLHELRQRALALLEHQGPAGDATDGSADLVRLVEELRIYQTELEIQNQELARSQSAMTVASARYQALFAGLPIPAMLCDTQGFIVESNSAAQRLMGLSGVTIIQRYALTQFVDYGSRPWVQSLMAPQERAGTMTARQVSLDLGDGLHVPTEIRIRQLEPDFEGQIFNLVILIDKSLEMQYAQQSVDLARARDAAEAASTAKTRFLANMSHELRTPLSGIIGLTHILLRLVKDGAQLDKLQKIRHAGEHLTHVIDGILDLARIESGKMQLDQAIFAPHELMAAAISLVEPKATAKHLRLICEVDPDTPARLLGDPLRLKQALLNYLGNAVKFTESGRIWVRVRPDSQGTSRVRLHFEVQDEGPGIPQEIQDQLFAPFTQGDDTLSRRHGGTGLGLSITRQLAQLMGGDAGLFSALGQGSRFWFTAEFEPAPAPPHAAAEAPDPAELCRQIRQRHAGRRVLICEDDPFIAEIIEFMLQDVDLEFHCVDNGALGVDAARGGTFALILMDMQMPVMGGVEATVLIRQIEACRDVPIVALTANAFDKDREDCLKAGMTGFLRKPIDAAGFYLTLSQQLER